MKLRITPHSGFAASRRPADAMDLLWERLEACHDEASFGRVGHEICATWGEDVPASMDRHERAELGRHAVLRILREVCERPPELELDWFAVGFFR
jgi:hypothetical protein